MIFFINIIKKIAINSVLQGIPFPPAPASDDLPPPPPPLPIDGYDFFVLIFAIFLALYILKKNTKLTN